ncbi:MAG: hypothetical protein A3E87_01950 [Gammaproteobacteria bacterium RIFCSPHIGHO2_12_FULL_35_23]|nr:MAG: hypothetical protein A3E87_01950 [Gammaproteobacteria bacterium RIFCSPHIGHO2_12_FULL_35_23]
MNLAFISPLRCHMFDLANELLSDKKVKVEIFTTYPYWKLKSELLSKKYVSTFPWLMVPRLALQRWHLLGPRLDNVLNWQVIESFDKYVATKLTSIDILEGMSSFSLKSGQKIKQLGGKFIIHHGSAHSIYQSQILAEEAKRWQIEYRESDPKIIEKALLEFELADAINLPSPYGRRTFIEQGINPNKIAVIPYGVNTTYFSPGNGPVPKDFQIIYAGQISLRKGIPYLLQAFNGFKHPNKKLLLVGEIWHDMKQILHQFDLTAVELVGRVTRSRLQELYQSSQVMVLPSIDDGFGKVITEAMACGCPVIASENTGAYGFLQNDYDGYVVPIRNSQAILEKLQILADCPEKHNQLASNALKTVQAIGGWKAYANDFYSLCEKILI